MLQDLFSARSTLLICGESALPNSLPIEGQFKWLMLEGMA